MSRFKRSELKHIKDALHKQLTEEIENQEKSKEEEGKLTKKDLKEIYKSSALQEEIKPSKQKQYKNIKRRIKNEDVLPKKTVSWQHKVGDLVEISSKSHVMNEAGYGIIIDMSDADFETKINDSRSLVFSPIGRQWYYTKNLKKI